MKIVYDQETDSLTITLHDERIQESDEVRSGKIVDFDYDDKLVCIEILLASQVVQKATEIQFVVEH